MCAKERKTVSCAGGIHEAGLACEADSIQKRRRGIKSCSLTNKRGQVVDSPTSNLRNSKPTV
eukprot:2400140-Rhodomonas_salina.1